jgi:F0F1-type ATP synthase membrane subunit a
LTQFFSLPDGACGPKVSIHLLVGGIAPLALTVALTALELLVAFLQAYVFAMLTCIYLNDALHPGH